VTGTSVRDDDWSSPTHYAGGQPIEPRMFTEADPMTALLPGVWRDEQAEQAEQAAAHPVEPRWSTTTYVGRPRRRDLRRQQRAGTAPQTAPAQAAPAAPTPAPAAGAPPAPGRAEPATERPAVTSADRGLMANSRTMAIASLTSRVTGFLRSILLVAALGSGAVGNAYSGGNTFPNMIYELLLGGVLSSVLIPLLVKAEAEDEDGGLGYTQRLLSISAAALGAMTIVVVALAPYITGVFVPAGQQRELATLWASLLLPEIFFYGLGAMFMAVLNIRHSYAPGAWSPVLNNVIMIVTIGVFWALPGPKTLSPATITTPQVVVVGLGTTLGIAAQALVLVPYLRQVGFRWKWRFRARPNEVGRLREVGVLGGWVFGYVVASQIGVSVIQRLGFHNGGLTVFTQVDLLFQVPYGVLVVSVLTAIMPRMSRAAVRGDTAAVVGDLSLAARLSAVAMVPVTAGLIALGLPLCITLFAHGQTDMLHAHLYGTALAWSAFGLFPFAVVMLQLRVFYAMRDGRTPTLINVVMVATKVALVLATNAIYSVPKGVDVNTHPSVAAVEWLNVATSLSYVVGAVAGHVLLSRRLGRLGFRAVARTVAQVSGASLLGGLAAWGVVEACWHALGHGHAGSAAGLVLGGAVGLAVLVVVLWRMRLAEVAEVLRLARR
jgi:putative peptidoglycan lipid II flippase